MTSSANRRMPAGNPIANIFVIVVGTLVIGASIVLGFFAFVIIGSVILILASIVGVRIWWFNRKLRGLARSGTSRAQNSNGGVIEGEYRVVADKDEDA